MAKIYKLVKGNFRDYNPSGEHADMIFFAEDRRLLYLNGVDYGGSNLISNTDSIKATEAEITSETPSKHVVYLCTENHTIYEWTENDWHKKRLKEGDFVNVVSYGGTRNVLLYWDGEKLVNASVYGVSGYIIEKLNELYYWFEG